MIKTNSPHRMRLKMPLKHIFVTQPFGKNYVSFYKDLGMWGH